MAAAREAGKKPVCTTEWLEGIVLQADGPVWFFEEEPYAVPCCAEKTGSNKRWCTRTGCVQVVTRTQKGHRSYLADSVDKFIEKQFGESQVGFCALSKENPNKTDRE